LVAQHANGGRRCRQGPGLPRDLSLKSPQLHCIPLFVWRQLTWGGHPYGHGLRIFTGGLTTLLPSMTDLGTAIARIRMQCHASLSISSLGGGADAEPCEACDVKRALDRGKHLKGTPLRMGDGELLAVRELSSVSLRGAEESGGSPVQAPLYT